MYKYKVSFWFGMASTRPSHPLAVSPSKIIEIESEKELSDNEATREALKKVGPYPKTYSTKIEKV